MLKEEKGVVSVWLGTVADRSAWDAYLTEDYGDEDEPISAFAGDLDEVFYDHDDLETDWRPSPVPVADLLSGHSYAQSFMQALLRACAARRINHANALILLYGVRPITRAGDRCSVSVECVGTFEYQRSGGPASPERRGPDHAGRVSAVAAAAGLCLTGAQGGAVKVWRLRDGACLGELPLTLGDWVQAIALDEDGRRAVIVGSSVVRWEANGAGPGRARTLGDHRGFAVQAASLSPDGRQAASGAADRTVKIWDLAAAREVATFADLPGRVYALRWSVDGRRVLAGDDAETVSCFDVQGRTLLWQSGHPERAAGGSPGDPIRSLALHPGGRVGLSGGAAAWIWSAETGEMLRSLDGVKDVVAVGFAGGRAVVVEAGGRVLSFSVEDDTPARVFEAHQEAICAAAFAADGRSLVTGSRDRTARVWDLETGRREAQFPDVPSDAPGVEPWVDDPYAVSAVGIDRAHIVVGEYSGRVHVLGRGSG